MSVLKIEHRKIPEKGVLDLGDLRLYFEDVGSNNNLKISAFKVDGDEESELTEGQFDTRDTDILIEMLQGFRSEIGLRG